MQLLILCMDINYKLASQYGGTMVYNRFHFHCRLHVTVHIAPTF